MQASVESAFPARFDGGGIQYKEPTVGTCFLRDVK